MKKITALALFLGLTISNFAQAQEEKSENNPKYRTWSVGLDLGANFLLGDFYASETNKKDFNDEFGKAGLAINADLTKWVNSAFGFQGQLGYAKYSGTRQDYAFSSGTALNMSANVLLNLNGFGARNRTKMRKDAWILHTGIGMNSADAMIYKNGKDSGIEFDLGKNPEFTFFDRDKNGKTLRTWYMPFGLEWRYRFSPRWDLSIGATGTWFMDDNADGSVTLIIDEFNNATTPGSMAEKFRNTTNDFKVAFQVGVNYYFAWKAPTQDDVIIYTDAFTEINKRVDGNTNNIALLMADKDKDGVSDYFDKEKETPEGAIVSGAGVALDTDGDGIPDLTDKDPFSTKGAQVNTDGVELDDDMDGVANTFDLEPNTPKGKLVNFQGKTIVDNIGGGGAAGEAFLPNIYFDFNKANITSANYNRLATVARFMLANPNVKLNVYGHTDKVGTESYNDKLSERRAKAAIKALVNDFGIDESRLTPMPKGESQLWSKRDDINRRVEFQIKK